MTPTVDWLRSEFECLLQERISTTIGTASCDTSVALLKSHGTSGTTRWVIDSSASLHISGNATLYSYFRQHSGNPCYVGRQL